MLRKNSVKNFIRELFILYLSQPDGKEKNDLDWVIHQLNIGKTDLKNLLSFIQKKVSESKSTKSPDTTLREINTKLWERVMKLFVEQLKP